MKYVIRCAMVVWILLPTSLVAGICCSKQPAQAPAPAKRAPTPPPAPRLVIRIDSAQIQLTESELKAKTEIANLMAIRDRVMHLSLFDLAFYKSCKNINAAEWGLQTELDKQWFRFLVDQRYQINRDVCKQIVLEQEQLKHAESQPGLDGQ